MPERSRQAYLQNRSSDCELSIGWIFPPGLTWTGEIYRPELGAAHPGRDWILTRILWLSGREPGYNRLGSCDSMRRSIYLHGTPDETFEQAPRSHGCIRMRNADLAALFQVPVQHMGVPLPVESQQQQNDPRKPCRRCRLTDMATRHPEA